MNQLSSLQKNLIFHWEGNEWNPLRDNISSIVGAGTDVYATGDRQGSGNTRNFSYNGTSDVITLPASMPPFSTGDFTVIRKVKTGAIGAVRTLIGGAANSFELYISATGYLTALKYGGSALTASTTLLAANTEYKLAYIKSGSTGTYYVNNTAAGTTTDTNDYSVKCTLLGNGTGFFNGLDFMTRCFNFALTPTVQLVNYSRPEYPIEWVDRGATGAELITNTADRDFSSDTGFWSIGGSGISITEGVARWSASSAYAELRRAAFVIVGKKYRIMYDIPTRTSGSIFCNVGISGTVRSTTGTAFKDELIATRTTLLWGAGSVSSTLDIDNVSVTQLGCILDLNAEGMTSAYWYDKTNSLTATVTGATLQIPSASNLGAMWFNGTTSKISLSSIGGLPQGGTDRTLCIWLHKFVLGVQEFPLAYGSETALLGAYMQINTSNKIQYGNSQFGSIQSATALVANRWYFLCITYGSQVANYYIDGVYDSSGTLAGITNTTGTTVKVGEFFGVYGNLLLEGAKIYNYKLSSETIKLLYDQGH